MSFHSAAADSHGTPTWRLAQGRNGWGRLPDWQDVVPVMACTYHRSVLGLGSRKCGGITRPGLSVVVPVLAALAPLLMPTDSCLRLLSGLTRRRSSEESIAPPSLRQPLSATLRVTDGWTGTTQFSVVVAAQPGQRGTGRTHPSTLPRLRPSLRPSGKQRERLRGLAHTAP